MWSCALSLVPHLHKSWKSPMLPPATQQWGLANPNDLSVSSRIGGSSTHDAVLSASHHTSGLIFQNLSRQPWLRGAAKKGKLISRLMFLCQVYEIAILKPFRSQSMMGLWYLCIPFYFNTAVASRPQPSTCSGEFGSQAGRSPSSATMAARSGHERACVTELGQCNAQRPD